jgi:hypothetical protein
MKTTTTLLMTCLGMLLSIRAFAAAPLPQVTWTKATVTFSKPSFTISYGQTISICATITPSRLAPKFTFVNSDSAPSVFTIVQGISPDCNGGVGAYLTVTSTQTACSAQGAVQAMFNGKVVKSAVGNVRIPTSEFAVLFSSVTCADGGSFCLQENFNLFYNGPTGPITNSVTASEQIQNRRQFDSRPECSSFTAPDSLTGPLSLGSNGLWGNGDTLEVPGGPLVPTGGCADEYDQVVTVGACPIQTNTLVLAVDASGNRSISRSDLQ